MTTSDRSFAKPLRLSKAPVASRSVFKCGNRLSGAIPVERKDWNEVKEKKNDHLEENRLLERVLLGVTFKF